MGLGEVVVNRVARLGGTLVAETSLPVGTFRTPQFIPKITTQAELDSIVGGRLLSRPPEMVCYEAQSVRRLTKKRFEAANQMKITGESSDQAFDTFRRNTIAMTDPQSEWFSFKRRYPSSGPDKVYFRQHMAKLDDFPAAIRDILARPDAPWHDQFWGELISSDLLIPFIDWCVRQQETSSPGVLLPPTIVVDGNRALDIATAANDAAARAFPPGEDGIVPSGYLILHQKVFMSSDFVDTIISAVSELANAHRLVALKVLDQNDVVNHPVKRPEFARFLGQVDGIKQQSGDSVAVLALDSGEPGLATMGNGIDAYVEPLSGFVFAHPLAIKTDAEKAKEAADLDLVRKGYWLHPLERVDKPMSPEEIALLCDCPTHKEFQDRKRTPAPANTEGKRLEASPLPPLGDDEMAMLRKIHHYNVRVREIELLAESVGMGDSSFLNRVLRLGSNQNLLKLLPSGNRALG